MRYAILAIALIVLVALVVTTARLCEREGPAPPQYEETTIEQTTVGEPEEKIAEELPSTGGPR